MATACRLNYPFSFSLSFFFSSFLFPLSFFFFFLLFFFFPFFSFFFWPACWELDGRQNSVGVAFLFPPFGIYVVGMYQPGSPMCAQKRRELEPTARKNNCFLRLKTIGRQWGGGGSP